MAMTQEIPSPPSPRSELRWADIYDDPKPWPGSPSSGSAWQDLEDEDEQQLDVLCKPSSQVCTPEEEARLIADGLPSVGSRHHDAERCKPCAFFHTKGCQSGLACLFCHLCPAHEKQRRKRLRRMCCNGIPGGYDRDRGYRVGHSRQNSNHSFGTASTSTGPPGSFGASTPGRVGHHSRQWSTSTQESMDQNGFCGGVPHRHDAPILMLDLATAQAPMMSMGSPMGSPHDMMQGQAMPGCGMTQPQQGDVFPISPCGGQSPMAGAPGSPAGFVTYGGVQYALMPVPMPQCQSNNGFSMAPPQHCTPDGMPMEACHYIDDSSWHPTCIGQGCAGTLVADGPWQW